MSSEKSSAAVKLAFVALALVVMVAPGATAAAVEPVTVEATANAGPCDSLVPQILNRTANQVIACVMSLIT